MREDLDALLNAILPLATNLLEKNGEFYPFGATMDSDGTVSVAAIHAEGDRSQAAALIAELKKGFQERARSGAIKASGLCYDTKLNNENGTNGEDAIVVDLESAGECARIAMPYRKKLFRGYTFHPLTRLEMAPEVF